MENQKIQFNIGNRLPLFERIYDKSEEGDSTSIMNAGASPGRWKPGVSKIRRKITPKLQAE